MDLSLLASSAAAWLAAHSLTILGPPAAEGVAVSPVRAVARAIKKHRSVTKMRDPVVLNGALARAMACAFYGTVAELLEEDQRKAANECRKAQKKIIKSDSDGVDVNLPEDLSSGRDVLIEAARAVSNDPGYRAKVDTAWDSTFEDQLSGELTLNPVAKQQWLALRFDRQDKKLDTIVEQTEAPLELDDMQIPPDRDEKGPTALLHPNRRWIDFVPRGEELRELKAWLEEPAPLGWRLVLGAGGTGKTRLAGELVDQTNAIGWEAGLLHGPDLEAFLEHPARQAKQLPRPTLLVIDYATRDEQLLRTLLVWAARHALANLSQPLRLLLLDRVGADPVAWLDDLLDGMTPNEKRVLRDCLSDSEELAAAEDPLSWAKEIMARTGAKWQAHISGEETDVIDVSTGTEGLDRLAAITDLRPLYLQLLAIQVQESGSGDAWQSWSHGTLLANAVEREREHIRHRVQQVRSAGTLADGQEATVADLVEDAVSVLTLLDGASQDDSAFNNLLSALVKRRGRTDNPDEVKHVLVQLVHRDGSLLRGLEPDAIGSAFVARAFTMRPEQRDQLMAQVVDLGGPRTVLRMLLLAQDLEGCQEHFLDGWELLRETLAALPDDIFEAHLRHLPRISVHLARLVALFSEEEVRRARGADDAARLAGALNDFCVRLSEAGQRGQALKAAKESVEIRSKLAAKNPDAYMPDLAHSLTNLGARLSDAGRPSDALQVARDAVDLYRKLVKKSPDAHLPDLAMSLSNLGARLSDAGRPSDALQVARDAVDLYRKLVKKSPDVYMPDLAHSLTNLGALLSDAGRPSEALEATQEALDFYRKHAEKSPDAHLPDLALGLHNLGHQLRKVGRPNEGLDATKLAVEIRRTLVKVNPDAHLPDLAMSLHNLGVDFRNTGRPSEALHATEESVELRRMLAKESPNAHVPDLALSLTDLGVRLIEAGRRGEALQAAEDAVHLYRNLVKDHPDAYLPYLAMSHGALGLVLQAVGRHAETTESFVEGLKAIKAPLADLPPAYAPLASDLLSCYERGCDDAGIPADSPAAEAIRSLLAKWRTDTDDRPE